MATAVTPGNWHESRSLYDLIDGSETADLSTLMIDASHVKTHRIAANGVKKTQAMVEASAEPKAG